MKYHTLILFVASLLLLGLLGNCGKDDTEPSGEAPTLSVSAVIVGGPSLSDNGEAVATDTIDFFIDVTAPAGFNSILIGGSGHSIITASDVGVGDTATQINDANFRVLTVKDDGEATASYVFVAVDELGQESDSVVFTFTIGPIVDTFTNITLGGFQNTSTNGFLNAIENQVHSLSSAIFNASEIDLLFYHEGGSEYTIAAADDSNADVAIQAQTVTGDLDDFSVQNQTRFKTFTSNPGFNAVRSVTDLENVFSSNGTSGLSNVSNLSANNIFGVQLTTTRGDRIGLIRINQTSGTMGSNRAINFDLKIEPK